MNIFTQVETPRRGVSTMCGQMGGVETQDFASLRGAPENPQCGACYHFPGDGQKCPATLDTVSRKVKACGEYA
ncbi:MAG: hypothetical protein HY998_08585 [candidate division NC10 bacterium]|nr:hypothetical protein [candidate division NC10 bacterium]